MAHKLRKIYNIQKMKIKLNENDELELVYSFRSMIYFEQIQGKALDYEHFSANDLMVLFYCVFIASLQKAKRPVVTMLDFLDIIDDNGGEKAITDFSLWFTDVVTKQFDMVNSLSDEDKKEEATKKKKTRVAKNA
jgi:hypothetical protein